MEKASISTGVQFPQAVIFQGGGMGIVPKVVIVSTTDRKAQAAVSNGFPQLVCIIIQVAPRRLDLTVYDTAQAINHDLVRVVTPEPANMAFHEFNATGAHFDSAYR